LTTGIKSKKPSVRSRRSLNRSTESLLSLFEEFLRRSAFAPATIRNYLADLRGFVRWLENGQYAGSLPGSKQFSAYRDYLIDETEHSPSTVNRHLQALRVFGRCLQEQKATPNNPARDLALMPNGHDEEVLPRVLDYDEVEALIVAVRAGARPSLMRRDYAIIELMLQAGLRVNEVAALDLRDIASTHRGLQLIVRGAADDRYREVPLNEPLARALREYIEVRPALREIKHLFVSQRGQPLSTRSIQRLVESYAEAAQLDDVCASSLRHTCAKKMLEETKAPHLVAQWLGHKHVEALKRYQ
jgi:site-specific recombinase XerD